MRSQMKTGIEPIELGKAEYKNLRLRLADGAEIPAKIVWKDADHDLVLLMPTGATASNRTFIFRRSEPGRAISLGAWRLLPTLANGRRIPARADGPARAP